MRSSLLAVSFVAVVGCSAVSEEAGSQSADLVAPYWTEAESAATLGFLHYTGAEVPAGAACVPGSASFILDTSSSQATARSIQTTECVGAPARWRTRLVSLSDVQYTAIIGAARSVAVSEKRTCDPGADYFAFGVYPRPGANAQTRYATTDRLGCAWSQVATGIEHVLEIVEPIVAAAPPPPPSVFIGATPGPGSSVWTPGSPIFLAVGGAGDTPHGSLCARDAAEYTLTAANGQLQGVVVTKCASAPGDDRLALRSQLSRALTADEKARLTSALSLLRVSNYATCTPGARFEQLIVTSTDASGAQRSTLYSSHENACVLGTDSAPFVDVRQLRSVLETLTP